MTDSPPRLRHYPRHSQSDRGALLFVHGGYVDSSCWEFNFTPFFQRHGYDCYALDLSGHGLNRQRGLLHQLGLNDYANDLEQAVGMLDQPPIIVGHSMGARVIQRYLRRGHSARAAIFLAPVPSSGTGASAARLALRYPRFFSSIDEAIHGGMNDHTAALLTQIYFSPDTSVEMARQYVAMIGPESQKVLAELLLPEFFSQPPATLPVLVIGGSHDEVFDASMLPFIGLAWSAEVARIEGAGHMLMLDPRWAGVATQMHDWIAQRPL